MKKLIFYTLPVHGHTNPILPVLKELAKEYEIIVFSIPEFQKKIEYTGSRIAYYPEFLVDPLSLNTNPPKFAQDMINETERILPVLMRHTDAFRPDAVIHDAVAGWGKIIGHTLSVPAICYSTTAVLNNKLLFTYPKILLTLVKTLGLHAKHTSTVIRNYRTLQEKYALPANVFDFAVHKEKLNIVFTSKLFQPHSESFDDSYKFVGPSIYERMDESMASLHLNKKRKLIYISMGTIFNNDHTFFTSCIQAFAQTEYHTIISIGHRFRKSDFPNLPANISIANHIPQLALLPHVSVFISHGGMNSVNESLYYGVPLIVIPQMIEQKFNAYRVRQLQAGLYLRKRDVSVDKLRQLAEKITHDRTFRTNALQVRKSFIDAGGYKKAAAFINDYIKQNLQSKST